MGVWNVDVSREWVPNQALAQGLGSALDSVLGGAEHRGRLAYADQFKKEATAADAMWQARDNRARAIGREGFSPEVVRRAMDGDADARAQLGSYTLQAGATPNLSNITGGLGDFARMDLDRERRAAIDAGNVPQYNQYTALAEGKDYQPARVVAGNVLRDGVGLGDEAFAVMPLPQTQATIGATNATADARRAQAERTRANIGNDAAKTAATVSRANAPKGANLGDAAVGAAPLKPLPAALAKVDLDIEESLSAGNAADALLSKHVARLTSGQVDVSNMASALAAGRRFFDRGTTQDANLAELKADLTKMVNESLRLNKGVQTEGDAQRAFQEIMSANDTQTMLRGLQRMQEINARGLQLQGRKRDLLYRNAGRAPAAAAPQRKRYNPATGRVE